MNRIALPPDIELYPIEARTSRDIAERLAEKAGVIVSVFRRGERTTVRVRGNHELTETAIATKGAVIGFISRTIDKYRELYGDGPDPASWTADELLQVAAQSGLPVSRG